MIEQPTYPLYIPSKGRADSRLTIRALERMGTPYHVIVEEPELEAYRAVVNPELGTVLMLPWSYKEDYELLDDHGLSKSTGPGPARNFAWDHSINTYGSARHWVMDDNIRWFYRWHKNRLIRCGNGVPFAAMEDFCDRYENVAMAGPNYEMFVTVKSKRPPFITNTRIYSCNLILNEAPFRWRGRYNEDTILSLDMLEAGWCTIQFNAFLQQKINTQKVKGGNTAEFYDKEGTYPKSKMLADVYPQYAKVVTRFGRIHHHVDYRHFRRNQLKRRAPLEHYAATSKQYASSLRRMETDELVEDPPPTPSLEYSHGQQSADQAQMIEVNGIKALVRDGTSDSFVVKEVIKGNAYRKLTIRQGDVVLDAGLNIGMFSILAASKGASVVHSFEPSPENFSLALRNIKLNGYEDTIRATMAAVTGTEEPTRAFSLNVKRNKGAHSLVSKRGRNTIQVDAVSFPSLIKSIRPDVVKMDIEGGEYECLMATDDFEGVREIILEFHHAHLNDIQTRQKYHSLLEHLGAHFATVDHVKEPKKSWVTLIHASGPLRGAGVSHA